MILLVFNYWPHSHYGKYATTRLTPLAYIVNGLGNMETLVNSAQFAHLDFPWYIKDLSVYSAKYPQRNVTSRNQIFQVCL